MAAQKGSITHSTFLGHKDAVNCLEWSNSLSLLASASDDGTVRCFDPRSGSKAVRSILAFNKEPVLLVAWAPPSCLIPNMIVAATAKDIFGFDLRSDGLILREPAIRTADLLHSNEEEDEISSLHIQPKGGGLLAAADDSGAVHILEIKRRSAPARSNGPPPASHAAEDGQKDATPDNTWSLERTRTLSGAHACVCTGALFRPNNAHELVSGALDGTLGLWDLSKAGRPSWQASVPLLSGGGSAGEEEGGGNTGSASSPQSVNPPYVHGLSIHQSGRYFAAGLGDGSVGCWAFGSGRGDGNSGPRVVGRLTGGHSVAVAAVHFANFDEELLLSAGNDKRIAFWRMGSLFTATSAHSKKQSGKSKSASRKAMESGPRKGEYPQGGEGNEKSGGIADGEVEGGLAPHARLAHTSKINWIASSFGECAVHIADVSPVISCFDVSRV